MANVQIDSMTDTWNSGGTTFNAIKINVTDTASAAASKLLDLQVGGNTKANVTKAGLLTLASGVTLTGANTLQTTTGALTLVSGSSNIILTPSSNVGIGTTGPDRKLDVLDASNPQIRLSQADGTAYTDLQTLSTGHHVMTTSGGNRITTTTVNDTSVSARQIQGGLAFDGLTAGTGLTGTVPAIGLTEFTLHAVVLNPSAAITTGTYVVGVQAAYSTTTVGDIAIRFNATGIDIVMQDGSGYQRWAYNQITDYAGKIMTLSVVRSSATTLAIYINGVATTFTNLSTRDANLVNLTATVFRAQCATACNRTLGIFDAKLFNRALTASEIVALCNQGVQTADKSGNTTSQTSGTLSTGKRYRITTFVAGDSFTNVGAASNATGVEFVATGTTPTTWTNASTLNQIGVILDAALDAGVGYQALDRSGNKYNLVLSPTGVTWTKDVKWGTIQTTTNTSGNQQILGSTAIPTNAIIRNIVGYTTGTPTVQVGNVSGGSQLVASVAMAASTYTNFTLAAITSTTGNIWVNSSTADTINWTVYYIIANP